MRPKMHTSLRVAHSVLNRINLSKKLVDQLQVVGYENGREHGLCFEGYTEGFAKVTICWSESRNSDNIVVYVSNLDEHFEANTNIPTDRAYRAKQYFDCGEFDAAARFIADAVRRLFREGK